MSFETGCRLSSKATARALTKSDRPTKFLSPCRLDVGERHGDNFARHSAPRSMVLQVRSATRASRICRQTHQSRAESPNGITDIERR